MMQLKVSGYTAPPKVSLPVQLRNHQVDGYDANILAGSHGMILQQFKETAYYSLYYHCFWLQKRKSVDAYFKESAIVLHCMLENDIVYKQDDSPYSESTEGNFDLHIIPPRFSSKLRIRKGFTSALAIIIKPAANGLLAADLPQLSALLNRHPEKVAMLPSLPMGVVTSSHLSVLLGDIPVSNLTMISRVNEILVQYFLALEKYEQQGASGRDQLVAEIAGYLQSNFHESIQISKLSKLYHTHISTLEKLFKSRYNMGIKAYLLHCRMMAAAKLLRETRLSIKEISLNTGFTDLAYFSRAFKKYHKISPSNYRGAVYS